MKLKPYTAFYAGCRISKETLTRNCRSIRKNAIRMFRINNCCRHLEISELELALRTLTLEILTIGTLQIMPGPPGHDGNEAVTPPIARSHLA